MKVASSRKALLTLTQSPLAIVPLTRSHEAPFHITGNTIEMLAVVGLAKASVGVVLPPAHPTEQLIKIGSAAVPKSTDPPAAGLRKLIPMLKSVPAPVSWSNTFDPCMFVPSKNPEAVPVAGKAAPKVEEVPPLDPITEVLIVPVTESPTKTHSPVARSLKQEMFVVTAKLGVVANTKSPVSAASANKANLPH